LAKVANPRLAADVTAATHMAQAALHSAAANVRANLPFVAADRANEITTELERLIAG
jgi:formiminotetrahydrofolate cyclodeaminase